MISALGAKDETFSYSFNDYRLSIKDRITEGEIDLRKNNLQENKKYFFIVLDSKQVIFFPKHKLDDKTREKFVEYLDVS